MIFTMTGKLVMITAEEQDGHAAEDDEDDGGDHEDGQACLHVDRQHDQSDQQANRAKHSNQLPVDQSQT